jgi:hypothetical protein
MTPTKLGLRRSSRSSLQDFSSAKALMMTEFPGTQRRCCHLEMKAVKNDELFELMIV